MKHFTQISGMSIAAAALLSATKPQPLPRWRAAMILKVRLNPMR